MLSFRWDGFVQLSGNVSCTEHNVNTGLGASAVSPFDSFALSSPWVIFQHFLTIQIFDMRNSMEQCQVLWFLEVVVQG